MEILIKQDTLVVRIGSIKFHLKMVGDPIGAWMGAPYKC